MITFHVLGNPNSPVHIDNRIDAFAISIIKFIENMKPKGWNFIHYGIPGSNVPCETVLCLDEMSNDKTINRERYNQNAKREIKQRKRPGDIILCFHGWENQPATVENEDLLIVEPSIGYDHAAIFAPYRVFTSYAVMHMYYGSKGMLLNPSWWDEVIPNSFTPSEFEFSEKKENYILFFGRVIESKGIHLAIQATEATGTQLIIAGPGSLHSLGYDKIPNHVVPLGLCNAAQRKKLMTNARAIIGPTYYVEPFGNMVVEGYFSGTPAITTDWGGFTETVVNGVTGYRCREFKDFVSAINNIDKINPRDCFDWAMKNYSEEVVHNKHHNYFNRLISKNFYRS